MDNEKICMFNSTSSNVAAYCRYHHCSMTVKQIRCKNCLQKECWYLVKNEDHQWWKQRNIQKQKRKERKAMIDQMYQ